MTAATGRSHHADEREDRDRRGGGYEELRQVLAEERLQLLDAVDHREHHAAGAAAREPARSEREELVEQARAQAFLDAGGRTVRDHDARLFQRRTQHDRRRDPDGWRRYILEVRALKHQHEQAAEEHEPRDPRAQRQHPQHHAERDTPAQSRGHPPELPIEIHG